MSKKDSEKQKEIRVIIYGYCSATNMIIERLQPNVKVAGISDKFSNLYFLGNLSYYPLSELKAKEHEYDYIIITERYRIKALEIFETIKDLGINEDKIIPYFCYASFERYRLIFDNDKREDIKGLVLGNSHSTYGYDVDFFIEPTIKLSLPGSDIFDISQTVERVLKEYKTRLEKLEFIIIDLWTYNFINIDNSKSGNYLANMVHYGYLNNKHNYPVASDEEFAKELKEKQHVVINNPSILERMKALFGKLVFWDDEEYSVDIESKKWGVLPNYPFDGIPMAEIAGTGTAEMRKETIEENKKLLMTAIETINRFNPKVKVFFTLLPRYCVSNKAFEPWLAKWKPEFNAFMEKMEKKYEIHFLDYSGCDEVARERELYFDWTHLNAAGAAYMTSIIDRDIRCILNG